ncbi:MAG: hypothetical protein ACUVUU_10125, partial [bacterium]
EALKTEALKTEAVEDGTASLGDNLKKNLALFKDKDKHLASVLKSVQSMPANRGQRLRRALLSAAWPDVERRILNSLNPSATQTSSHEPLGVLPQRIFKTLLLSLQRNEIAALRAERSLQFLTDSVKSTKRRR